MCRAMYFNVNCASIVIMPYLRLNNMSLLCPYNLKISRHNHPLDYWSKYFPVFMLSSVWITEHHILYKWRLCYSYLPAWSGSFFLCDWQHLHLLCDIIMFVSRSTTCLVGSKLSLVDRCVVRCPMSYNFLVWWRPKSHVNDNTWEWSLTLLAMTKFNHCGRFQLVFSVRTMASCYNCCVHSLPGP